MGSICLFVFNANVTMTHDRGTERALRELFIFHLFSIWFMQFSIHSRYFSLLKQDPSSRAIVWCDPTQRNECAKFWIFFSFCIECVCCSRHIFSLERQKNKTETTNCALASTLRQFLSVYPSVYAFQTRETFLRKNNIHFNEQTRWQWIFAAQSKSDSGDREQNTQIERAKKKTEKKYSKITHSFCLLLLGRFFVFFFFLSSLRFGRRSRPSAKGQLIPHTTKISLCVRFFVWERFRRDDALCV